MLPAIGPFDVGPLHPADLLWAADAFDAEFGVKEEGTVAG
jgi:hypothetical protein